MFRTGKPEYSGLLKFEKEPIFIEPFERDSNPKEAMFFLLLNAQSYSKKAGIGYFWAHIFYLKHIV